MRFVRIVLTVAALLVVAGCAEASANSASVWVRVSPTTLTAGYQTDVRASCGENANAGTVTSPAFGSVTLQPVGGVLNARVTVPATTPKGTYDVRLTCPTGSRASTTLTVLGTSINGQPQPGARGPDTGGGFLANGGEAGEDPVDRSTFVWLAAGLGCLAAAAALGRRHKRAVRRSVRPDDQTVRTGRL